jgi:predicted metal-binding membrane protein
MNTIHIILIFLLIFISSIMWIVSLKQYDTMMSSMMMFYNPVGLSLFTLIWTAGMAAMMFPAIAPMVLLYDRLIKSNNISSNNGASGIEEKGKSSSPIVGKEKEQQRQEIRKKSSSWSPYPFKIILFVGSYLAVWALTGIAILIGWSIPMNYFFSIEASSSTKQHLDIVFGALLIISGLYQFSPLKTKCLGYCESPMSFFMRRWRSGITGAIKMGTHHGLYCLGCCWPYFLLMVALGWMNLLWMALFAAIIFGEKIWIRGGRWIARSAGIAFMVLGVLALLGILDVPTGDMEEVSKDNTPVEKDNGMNMMEMNMGNNENDHR